MGALATVTSILSGGFLQGIGSIIDHIRGKSPEDAAKLEAMKTQYAAEFQLGALEFEKQQLAANVQGAQMQTDVNKVEAANTSLFIAGWRPFIGWVCGSGLAFQFIVGPLVTWIAALAGKPVTFPALDLGTLLTLLLGMLGLGGMRTFEKINKVA